MKLDTMQRQKGRVRCVLNSLRGRGVVQWELEAWALTKGGPRLDQEQSIQ